MCGIVGFYGSTRVDTEAERRKFILNALLMDQVRGEDSTGIALLPKKDNETPSIYKKAMSGADFINMPKTLKLLNRLSDASGVIGHNRSATWKEITDNTAHPFIHKNITLVHNGSINNFAEIAPKCTIGVDSAHIAHAFGEGDPQEILSKLRGDFSLVWHDASDNSLHFARNGGRPMYWMFDMGKNTLYYGSEYSILWSCAKRNNVILNPTVWETETMTHYKFASSLKVSEFTKLPFQLPVTPILPKREWDRTPALGTTGKTIGSEPPKVYDVTPQNLDVDRSKEALLEKATLYGLKLNESVDVYPRERFPYKDLGTKSNHTLGYVRCLHMSSGCWIELHGTTVPEYIKWSTQKMIRVLLTGIRRKMTINDKPVFVGVAIVDMTAKRTQNPAPTKEEVPVWVSKTGSNVLLSKEKFMELCAAGCIGCGDPIELTDAPELKWVGKSAEFPVCKSCQGDTSLALILSQMYTSHE